MLRERETRTLFKITKQKKAVEIIHIVGAYKTNKTVSPIINHGSQNVFRVKRCKFCENGFTVMNFWQICTTHCSYIVMKSHCQHVQTTL